MNVHFTPRGWNDYLHWMATDPSMVERILRLVEDARRSPFKGLGKPEPLKADFAVWWSRRLTSEHRLLYRVVGAPGPDPRIEIAACRFHYGKL